MKYKTSNTIPIVKIIRLTRLGPLQQQQCKALLLESGKCYSDIIQYLNEKRILKEYPSNSDVQKLFKGKYQLHSQTIQAITQKIDANIKSAISNRKKEFEESGYIKTEFPYKSKTTYPVFWKQFGISIKKDKLSLSNGVGRQSLGLNIPQEYLNLKITNVELKYRAKEFYLHLTIDSGEENPPILQGKNTCGIDLGEIHHAACCTDKGEALIISGRHLRSLKQQRNKQYKEISFKLKGKKNKSSLKQARRKIGQKFRKQQRDILHKVSRQITNFCVDNKIAVVAIGECSGTQDSPNLGKSNNQKISQWSRGQLINLIKYIFRRYGIKTNFIPEDYSSRTCSICKHVKNSSTKGRTYTCSNCKNSVHRDGNGSANICSRSKYNEYGKVQLKSIKYLQPIKLGCSRAAASATATYGS